MILWLKRLLAIFRPKPEIIEPPPAPTQLTFEPQPKQEQEPEPEPKQPQPEQEQKEPAAAAKRRLARARVADRANDLLDRFEAMSQKSISAGSIASDCEEALSYIIGCDFHLYTGEFEDRELGLDDERAILNPEAEGQGPEELASTTWPIDIGVLSEANDEDGYRLTRVFSVSPSEVRGKVRMTAAKMVMVAYGHLYSDGGWWAETRIAGLVNNRWVPVDDIKTTTKGGKYIKSNAFDADTLTQMDKTLSMAFSIALTERYDWHVAFGSEAGPRILLPTSSNGACALFRDRDKPEDRSRRAALRHWVENHWRSTEENLVYVRDHLRGATRFSWWNLDCELLVSAFDLEKNQFFKQQAANWRASRTHNRVRVRLKKRR